MLRNVKELIGYKIHARDDDIGHVDDFYFDDQKWTIRYLVVDTGSWMPGKKVLISPVCFYEEPDWEAKKFPVNLTKELVEKWVEDFEHKPVSRQKEQEMANHFGWPVYWETQELNSITHSNISPEINIDKEKSKDPHLRSIKEVTGYHLQAKDGEIGHIHDFIVDDKEWVIRYLVVDTMNWLPGRKVLISPLWISKVVWAESKVYAEMLTQEQIKSSQEYNPSKLIDREYEEILHDHYRQPKYW